MAKTEYQQSTLVVLSVLLGSGMDCSISFCYKQFSSCSLSAPLETFKYCGECLKFLLMAAIELFLANLPVKLATDE